MFPGAGRFIDPLQLGAEICNSSVKAEAFVTAEKNPVLDFKAAVRGMCDCKTFAMKFNGDLLAPTKKSKLGFSMAGYFHESALQYGCNWNTTVAASALTKSAYNFYFHHSRGGSTVGVHSSYDQDSQKWASALGL